jgi:hypothetical protein
MTRRDAENEHVTVRLPDELPVLGRSASRILLAILVELTDVEDPDGLVEGDGRDR